MIFKLKNSKSLEESMQAMVLGTTYNSIRWNKLLDFISSCLILCFQLFFFFSPCFFLKIFSRNRLTFVSFQCIWIVWFGKISVLLLMCFIARSIAGCTPALFHPLSEVFTSIKPPICNIVFCEETAVLMEIIIETLKNNTCNSIS